VLFCSMLAFVALGTLVQERCDHAHGDSQHKSHGLTGMYHCGTDTYVAIGTHNIAK
jgi:hypothetical protein